MAISQARQSTKGDGAKGDFKMKKTMVIVDMSSGRYEAFIDVEGFGVCHPRSKAAEAAPEYQHILAESLQRVLREGTIDGMPIQEFLRNAETEII